MLETFVDFDCEISVVAARGSDGEFVHYGAIENRHRNGILNISLAPARVSDVCGERRRGDRARGARETGSGQAFCASNSLSARDGRLLINELAPRPHNSGHFTFDANVTSQFEQQLRAVCGLPLGRRNAMRTGCDGQLAG